MAYDQLRADTERKVRELEDRVKALEKALRPFAAACFNDNGEVTISTGHIHTGDWMHAKRVMNHQK